MTSHSEKAVEMFVVGLLLDPNTQAPIVVLKDETGEISLPIWIGVAEATSIASALKNLTLPRPMTHDLIYQILNETNVQVQRIVITDLKDATYFSELVLSYGDRVMVLDSRPSDSIAVALRAAAPIFVYQTVLDQAKAAFPVQLPAATAPSSELGEEEGKPGEFEIPLDQEPDFKQIDKDKWPDILAELDPDDFKYKM